ncbi:DUF962 domain-containing protein [Echinimonas agarilytica]|uniref:DUF962 domain-containing protein n=1 Tax=Echinimonas agarilytica TaxID=1215918 RepID=A0AA41W6V4_9GAMM|nr:Mpo1-like protein [Echinimonas agarilytica]MCM2679849.1 DUF962 domain-containing protein [Echinimonas agarilytica]
MPNASLHQLLDKYGESHQNKTNKLIHWICVPAIFFSVVALVWSIPVPSLFAEAGAWLNWATIALALALFYYVRLSIMMAFGMLLFSGICAWLSFWLQANATIPLWQLALSIFVVAWVGQFIGHHIEGKKPSFFDDFLFLLIGPAWLMHFLYQRLGIRF